MSQAAYAPARWAAVEQLQRRCANRDPSSFEFEVADHAISLALNPNRPIDAFFARNVHRDAKSIVARRRRRVRSRFVPLYGRGHDNELALSADVEDGLTKDNAALCDLERSCISADAYARLRAALEKRNRYAPACLDGWRDGQEASETAAALGISRDYVKKLRCLIREIAAEVFSPKEWAQ